MNRREQARKLVANGTDPAEDRKEQKHVQAAQVTTFAGVFEERLDLAFDRARSLVVGLMQTLVGIRKTIARGMPCLGA